MPAYLRASGESFAVDDCLRLTQLTPAHVYRKGHRRFKNPAKTESHTKSGFHVEVSKFGFGGIHGQTRQAIAFLKRNKPALEQLRNFPGLESIVIDFGYNWRNVAAQFDFLPPELLQLAGNLGIGIVLSVYNFNNKQLSPRQVSSKS